MKPKAPTCATTVTRYADFDQAALSALLARHDNLVTDTSGLDYPVLVAMLRRLDPARVVFGSDALYTPMWKSLVMVLRALEAAGHDPVACFPSIAGETARRMNLGAS